MGRKSEDVMDVAEIVPLEDIGDVAGGTSPEDEATYTSLEEQTRKIIGTLTPREEEILRKRFGLLAPIGMGSRFAVSRRRIRQIKKNALSKLKDPQRKQKSPSKKK